MQYLTVRVGEMWYGIPLPAIIEVIHMVALAELPGTQDDILGLLTLRDHLMPVVDLQMCFDRTPTRLHLNSPIVAVRAGSDEQMIGFVVDEVEGVVVFNADTPVKATNTPYLAGAVQLESYVLLILDLLSLLKSVVVS